MFLIQKNIELEKEKDEIKELKLKNVRLRWQPYKYILKLTSHRKLKT